MNDFGVPAPPDPGTPRVYSDHELMARDNVHEEHASSEHTPPNIPRKRSTTLIIDDEEETLGSPGEAALSRVTSGDQVDLKRGPSAPADKLVETVIEWKQGGKQVYVMGGFTGWRQMIPLHKFDDKTFGVVLKLSEGTHRLRFVVDGELRCSDTLPTATDSMGTLVNFIEIQQPEAGPEYVRMTMSEVQAAPSPVYTCEIPEIFVDPEALDRMSSSEFSTPPHLPPHLDGVILNANWSEKDNNSVLPVPNHVVLNHLATTSIRHNVLAVASVSRYYTKFVTQVLYAPLQ